ncbi:MAG: 50S ribosomal protein L21 [Candidatus Pacebacteria bacterium CG10_big_fil_rev_8_21_14_0_10_36_11]|nr:50S ribosomal protein L21 [Candidatus Pacearchaeota archaeon]OIP74571.1 MAG: 50S ribosomal protein L21 [Candidatus Pacebacteria bacterium CG2_30_36_39]PIR65198.1 MAG: 50S ribosomal protein L21 [Candidatus Pacebacteria bacterium CG10_big_fil_rev_8_21_14_0_10_36_11]PJC42839.1 MAG: 50S ribosomal protein L21 [Candidatus Pacebacteria bacterium CG_4_9_14_0_2_um_filter_36_8]
MSKYAVIQLLGKQFQVEEGQTLIVDSLDQEIDKKFDVTDVLLVADGDKISVGQPTVEKAKVTMSVVAQGKGEKIRVLKYKSKSRYRKVHGHRQHQTTLKVEKITA